MVLQCCAFCCACGGPVGTALRSVTRNFDGITTVRPFPPPKHTYHTIHVCDMHARKKRELRICLQEFIVCGCSHLLVFIRLTRRGREWVNFRSNRIASQCDATPSQSSNLLIIKRQIWEERSKIFKDALHRSFLHSKTPRQNPERRNPFFSTNHQLFDLKFGSEIVFKQGLIDNLKSF